MEYTKIERRQKNNIQFIIRDRAGALYAGEEFGGGNAQDIVRAKFCVELMEKYKYPADRIWLRHFADIDVEGVFAAVEVDMVVLGKNKRPFMVVEVALEGKYEENLDVSVLKLYRIAKTMEQPKFLLYYTTGKFFTIDCKEFPTFEAWHMAGRKNANYIPDYEDKRPSKS
jgi:hypothetical protein